MFTPRPSTPDTPDGLRRLWGRRKAFALRPRQAALMEELLPRLRIALPESATNIDPTSFFDRPVSAVSLEIGFGGGEHLIDFALAHPGEGFIGVEPFVNGMAKMLAHIDDRGVPNVRLFAGDARRLVEALADASLARVFLLFPDPWPKLRHHKRRYVQDDTLQEIARVLKDAGVLRIASDIPAYVTWTLDHLARIPELKQREGDRVRRGTGWPATRYEQKALRAGRAPTYLEFERIPR